MASALIESAPRTICLQISDDEFDHGRTFPASGDGVTWCAESVLDCEVNYIRADIFESVSAELKEAQSELTRLRDFARSVNDAETFRVYGHDSFGFARIKFTGAEPKLGTEFITRPARVEV